MVTLKDVAKRAGVSVCTASRVLTNTGYLKDSTRNRVLAAIQELGYVHNRAAAELKTGTSNTIALVLPDIENLFYSHLAEVIEQYAYSKGFLVFICNTEYEREKEDYFLKDMSTRKIRGLIAVPVASDVSSYRKYLVNVPFVVFNRNLPDDDIVCFKIDNRQATRELTSLMIEIGKRNIAGIFRSFSNDIYRDRYEGTRDTIVANGLEFKEENMICDADDSDCEERLRALFSRDDHPDALVASNDMFAYSAYKVLNELGLHIPVDQHDRENLSDSHILQSSC